MKSLARYCGILLLLFMLNACTFTKFYSLNGASLDYNTYKTI